jgi:hypothetical protein
MYYVLHVYSGWTRVLYSTEVKLFNWIPEFVITFLTKTALVEVSNSSYFLLPTTPRTPVLFIPAIPNQRGWFYFFPFVVAWQSLSFADSCCFFFVFFCCCHYYSPRQLVITYSYLPSVVSEYNRQKLQYNKHGFSSIAFLHATNKHTKINDQKISGNYQIRNASLAVTLLTRYNAFRYGR